jgi:ketosteroid isomerase-like protein
MNLSDADERQIRFVVEQQLEAFQADDGVTAFSLATPEIQAKCGGVERFMAMVRQGYEPVYRPRSVIFEGVTRLEAFPAQQLMVMTDKGELVRALYVMQRQRNGEWKIAACYLLPIATGER